mmetsp:Transcript_14058/g.18333  ORF Transcript_14058/g.18333 Transcript_14058/m.18333 type:complete len:138 (+) Transcript_14058:131-544(+)|eukprot:CAMPEP_0198137824 /NCGR_PEP_ID=MMETSP1443-20131203/1287_1 /TAXON_ID=186043 /ORGANISM="Entomoneis sp., Strain CCMP2396" /LENGTH=137 /DNA_ID=CAMNT_0043799383 /DNA_START=107 /DNA_END=520 /DNA_ORIENTATION=-
MIGRFLLFILSCALANAFAPCADFSVHHQSSALQASRREAFGITAGVVFGTGLLVGTLPAFADVDDLSTPSEEEQKAAEDAALKAKLKRKAELQKKAARPVGLTNTFKGEMDKQKDFSAQSKSARRDAMCEELGRGC